MIAADERWRFVGRERERWWAWVALGAGTRRVAAVVAGGRDERTAQCPWDALPGEYRDAAVVATGFPAADRAVVPEGRHAAGGKGAGMTGHVERFWCTVRQRCGRFVRKTLSFSRCKWNHVGALWYFIRQYNACRL